ncbi:MAG: Sapep family Mn(2+)-dependent dipeptidase [Mycoplasmatales bacterium]
MKAEIKTEIEKILPTTIEEIQAIVKIDSVRNTDAAAPGAPFGPGIRQSLEYCIELAKKIGMRTYIDPDGLYGYAEIGPENGEMLGILGHLDVVPIGELAQWTVAGPFSGEIVNDHIIGRGTLDDKGPVIINLMAIQALVNLNVEFTRRIRVILGTAEETTWQCMDAYFAKEEAPALGFTPDAQFPLINAEKSIAQFDLKAKNTELNFTLMSNGAYNAVADTVVYTGPQTDELKAELDKLNVSYKENGNELTIIGKSAHAAVAHEKGDNAIISAAIALDKLGVNSKLISFLAQKVGRGGTTANLFGIVEDEVSGKMSLNVGLIQIADGQELVGMDSRIPVLVDENEIVQKYQTNAEAAGLEFELKALKPKLYVPADSELVETLLNVYKDVSGDDQAVPLSTGGGTYARTGQNLIAFGFMFEAFGQADTMHQPNEALELKYVPMALEIYANAIYKLAVK